MHNPPPRGKSGSPAARPYGDVVQQYLDLRDQNPGVILLYRIGSFYEVLFEDADLVADVLGLKLSERPSGGSAAPVPQCGFTHHALDSFLARLLSRGYRVAVCEEEEDAGQATRQRSIVRTLTPGTVTDPKLLREDRPSYLVALASSDADRPGLAWTDVSVGEFHAGEFVLEEALAEIQRLDPAEILVPSDVRFPDSLLARRPVTRVGPATGAAEKLREAFPDAGLTDMPGAEVAAGLIVDYLERTQAAGEPLPIDPPRAALASEYLRLDAATQRHLEIVETEIAKEKEGSLLAAVDRTLTPMGRRMLRSWLLSPLTDLAKINVRLRIVSELVGNAALRDDLAERFRSLPDIERLAGRAAAGKASATDLGDLADLSGAIAGLHAVVQGCRSSFLRGLGNPRAELAGFSARATAVLAPAGSDAAIRDDAGPDLAAARRDLRAALAWQAGYLDELRRLPNLGKVKLERNSTQGLFLEVPVNTPVPAGWIRRGGLQKVERYTTLDLDAHAVALEQAEASVAQQTRAILDDLRAAATAAAPAARDLARRIAAVDALLSFARVAVERGWVQPEIAADGVLAIAAGRHPVVERTVASFQSNDARLVAAGDRDQVVVLTGPNMAGKSTWMRQVALIVLLAQAGSYVPARQAHIGIVDAIFTRIGAADDLQRGRSTFMVEMLETATVLEGATEHSLVILDEIGRGTSTHDGMAIAWAVVEHLAHGPVRPRTIAATHYHELAALQRVYPNVTLLRAMVEERPDGIFFPHRIEAGAADRSFGIEVARLAGLPVAVIDRARQVADLTEPFTGEVARRLADTIHRTPRPEQKEVSRPVTPDG